MYDVAIVGGGPAGTTCASLLLKYAPGLKVVIVEREAFPRDHVGESQLPAIGGVLDEMGVWDAVEAAGFPIKVGATYRWGRTDDLWDFEFVPDGKFVGGPRPARFEGQRRRTAFQVDRAVYDTILLDHARSFGAEVRQPVAVRHIRHEGDRIEALVLDDGSELTARHTVDASGHAGIVRRAMSVETDVPTSLQNVAVWDYWQNAEWAVSIGVGGTRVQVLSLGYGWIWFIPLGPTRTSIGLIVPARYLKESGKRLEELYREALAGDPVVSRLTRNATPEGRLATTKDWSFLARRLAGENWWLAGESAGFADPILAAGMSLAHLGARDVAYAILAETRGEHDPAWLQSWYDEGNRRKIGQHIRFADFWYSTNGLFADLQEETRRIAGDAGLDLTPEEAWRWLGTGGFIDADLAGSGFGGYSVGAAKHLSGGFLGETPRYAVETANRFRLDLAGAERGWGARLENGRIVRHATYTRNGRALPEFGVFGLLIQATRNGATVQGLSGIVRQIAAGQGKPPEAARGMLQEVFFALESMVDDGWLEVGHDPGAPVLPAPVGGERMIHPNRDAVA